MFILSAGSIIEPLIIVQKIVTVLNIAHVTTLEEYFIVKTCNL
jgi:hypothetical protein